MGLDAAPAARLALFHTVFNLLGVALIWPLTGWLTHFLQARFRAAEEDEARPRYLDKNVLAVPALALDALEREVRNLGGIAVRAVLGTATPMLDRNRKIVTSLSQAIAEFIAQINRTGMAADSAHRLPELLRVARYYEAAAELASEAAQASREAAADAPLKIMDSGTAFRRRGEMLLESADPAATLAEITTLDTSLRDFEDVYQMLKSELLEAGAQGNLSVATMDARLRVASSLHRAVEQTVKAARMLVTIMKKTPEVLTEEGTSL